jgi:uncharacterized membrane protein YhaH (DUF805 family)
MQSSSTFGQRGAQRPAPPTPAPARRSPPARSPSSNGLVWLFFSYQGRCRRLHYWLGRFGLVFVYFTALISIPLMFPAPSHQAPDLGTALLSLVGALCLLGFSVAYLWAIFAIDVKRCHDRDKSGWFALISLVPLLSLWTLIELGFLDGRPGDNRFGPSPKGPDLTVFS